MDKYVKQRKKTAIFFTYFFDLPIFIWTSKTFRRGSIFWKLAQQYIQGAGKEIQKGPLPILAHENKDFLTSAYVIKVSVSWFWQRPETSEPSSAYLTVFLVSLKLREQCARRVEGPRRAPCQLKSPWRFWDQDEGEAEENTVFPTTVIVNVIGHWFDLQAIQWFLLACLLAL